MKLNMTEAQAIKAANHLPWCRYIAQDANGAWWAYSSTDVYWDVEENKFHLNDKFNNLAHVLGVGAVVVPLRCFEHKPPCVMPDHWRYYAATSIEDSGSWSEAFDSEAQAFQSAFAVSSAGNIRLVACFKNVPVALSESKLDKDLQVYGDAYSVVTRVCPPKAENERL